MDKVFVLSHPLRFRGTSARLAPDAAPVLDVVARVLRENPEIKKMKILVYWGDDSLSAPAAAKLTQAQAEVVRDAMVQRGVAEARLEASGLGTERPATSGGSAAAHARPRVELRVD